MTIKFQTREEWLTAAVEMFRPMFLTRANAAIPSVVRVSVGFPAGASVNKVIGQCLSTLVTKDKNHQVYINPILDNATDVLKCLSHELIHTVVFEDGHKSKFQRIFKALGHEGTALSIGVGELYGIELATMADELGEYPHSGVVLEEYVTPTGRTKKRIVGGPKIQTTRQIKVYCENEDCGFQYYTSSKHINAAINVHESSCGPCPVCGEAMLPKL
jgi:hypothetical protein